MITRDGLTDDEFCYLVRCAAFAVLKAEPGYPIVVPENSNVVAHERLAALLPQMICHIGRKNFRLDAAHVNKTWELTKKMREAVALRRKPRNAGAMAWLRLRIVKWMTGPERELISDLNRRVTRLEGKMRDAPSP